MVKIYKHLIAGFLALSFTLLFYINSFKLKESAAKLPRILMALIVILSIGMIIEAYWKSKNPHKTKKRIDEKQEDMSDDDDENIPINYKTAVIFTSLIAIYIFMLKPIGYFIITPIYIMVVYTFLKATSYRNMILISIGFTAFVYMIFVVFLKIPIPMGLMK